MNARSTTATLALFLVASLGCEGPEYDTDPVRSEETPGPEDTGPADDPSVPGGPAHATDDGYADPADWTADGLSPEWQARLGERSVDFGAALRIASLRLRGVLPTLLEMRMLDDAPDPALVYARLVESFVADERFAEQLLAFFRDVLKMGGAELDSAPLFATELALEGRSMTELFTATSGTCPTRGADGVIVPGDCNNGVPMHAGVLTSPDVMRHFSSNLAFRRVRWVQETFVCSAFPAEVGDPTDVGGAAPYNAPWPFESIAGADTGGRIDFHDVSSVICADCHATINHIAPLFGRFDGDGIWRDDFVVTLPSDGNPAVARTDWLPDGEPTAWRLGVPAPDLPALGAAMANDPNVHRCTVARVWNWALGKGDIVLSLSTVPESVIAPFVDSYVASGHRIEPLVLAIFTSDDFVRF